MLSFQQIRELVRAALEAAGGDGYVYIVDLYPDAVIYEGDKEAYFKRSYAITDGQVTLGEATPVEKQVEYVPLQAAAKLLAATGSPDDADYGYVWRVQVVEYGLGKDGRIHWPKEPLVAALALYDNAKVFALNDSQHQAPSQSKPFGKSVREIVGWLKNPQDTGTGIEADLYILKSAQWLRDALVDSHARGNPELLGLSHDVTARAVTKMVAGKRVKEPVQITAVEVDVVYDPTNNGRFLRMAAAAAHTGEEDMRDKLLAALKKARPDLVKQVTDETTDDQILQMLAAAAVKDGGGDAADDNLVAAVVAGLKKDLADETGAAGPSPELQEMKLLAAGITLDRELTASKLPETAQTQLRKRFEGQVFEVEALRAAIKDAKELIDEASGSGNVTGAGDVRVGRDSVQKFQAAVDRLFGVEVDEDMRDVAPFNSLRAAYVEMTGDTDVTGHLDPTQLQRMQAAYSSTTWSYVLGNTLYRRLVQDYREANDLGVSLLVGNNIRNARDFRTMESVRIGYYGDLPDVTPETVDYPDLGTLSDEEISYAINQKGGTITITRKHIINDDMRVVQKILSRLPRAARRTLAKRCWNKFISNATYDGDSTAVFHADHGNLGSTAYSLTTAVAARLAMAKQAEPGSAERLGLRPHTLAIPADLWDAAVQLNQTRGVPGSANQGNSMFQYFGVNNEHIFENPLMTDANDWMMFTDPNECEILELAYLNGQREPEMFVADNPAVGQMFVADKVQYKIRHEYECEIADYRGAYKAVVA